VECGFQAHAGHVVHLHASQRVQVDPMITRYTLHLILPITEHLQLHHTTTKLLQ
jgi:hypothetical protein